MNGETYERHLHKNQRICDENHIWGLLLHACSWVSVTASQTPAATSSTSDCPLWTGRYSLGDAAPALPRSSRPCVSKKTGVAVRQAAACSVSKERKLVLRLI